MPFNYLGEISRDTPSPSPFCLTGRVLRKLQVENGTIILIIGISNEHSQSSFNPKGKKSPNRTRFSTTPSTGKPDVTTSGLGSLRENFLLRDYLRKRSLLSQMQEDQVQSIIMKRLGGCGIAGVGNGVLIPFDVI